MKGEPAMPATVYAMDTNFYNSLGAYDFDARCEMLRELGYDATYLTLWSDAAWEDVPRLSTVKERYGLDVAAVYATLDIADHPDDEENGRIVDLVATIEGCDIIELSMRSSDPNVSKSDPAGDVAASRWLGTLLDIAERRGKTLALYPHLNFWMERIEDAVRLCRTIDHPNLELAPIGRASRTASWQYSCRHQRLRTAGHRCRPSLLA
jgi:sugar phosphate isomerase/epimerase